MAKANKYPIHIRLSEIPLEGAQFSYSEKTGELTSALKDLIRDHSYSVQVEIQPMGNLFKLTGNVSTSVDLLCSRCAMDLLEPIKCEFDELLLIDDPSDYKNGSQSRSHFSHEFSEEEPFCHYIKSDIFDLAEFIHEIIAINEPLRPLGRPQCEVSCENYDKAIKNGWITLDDDAVGQKRENPFQVLKGMKLNS